MKQIEEIISLYEKGDRVQTFRGVGTVLEDQVFENNIFGPVKVQLDENSNSHGIYRLVVGDYDYSHLSKL